MNNYADKGREQIDAAIMNYPGMVADIDLTAYMEEEQIHRIKSAYEYKEKLISLITGGGESSVKSPWSSLHGKFEFRQSELTIWGGFKGHGKALSLDTEIPTVSGWKTMKDICVGDQVFDENGTVCNVTNKTKILYERECYEILFSDGTIIVADANHEWLTSSYKARMSETHCRARNKIRDCDSKHDQQHKRILPSVVTTEHISETLKVFEGKKAEALNHAIESVRGQVNYKKTELPIPPYVLGAWLGDGSKNAAVITCGYADIELIDHIKSYGIEVKEVKSSNENSGLFRMNCCAPGKCGTGMTSVLRKIGLLNNKHVPDNYMTASSEDRMELLQGLLDTDGHVDKFGRVEFCNTNKSLALAVKELAASFGIVPTLITGRARLNGVDCGEKYRVCFVTALKVFKLSRKSSKLKKEISVRNTRRFIVSCKKIKSVPVQCIQVDSKSHLYLASRSYIPTHNSLLASQVLEKFIASGEKVFIISPEFPAHRVLHRMLIQSLDVVMGRNPEIAIEWLEAVKNHLWIYDQQSSLKPRDVPALCRYAVEEHGVNHILLDSLMKLGVDNDDYAGQKRLVDQIQQVAHRSKAHIHLVAHLKKGKDDSEVGGIHSVKGASEIVDLAENLLIVWRNKVKEQGGGKQEEPDCILKVEAQRNGDGWIGKIPLYFKRNNFTFEEGA